MNPLITVLCLCMVAFAFGLMVGLMPAQSAYRNNARLLLVNQGLIDVNTRLQAELDKYISARQAAQR